MKNINKFILVTALVAGFALAGTASAEGTVQSPRAQGNQSKSVSGTNTDPDVAHGYLAQTVAPRALPSSVKAGGTSQSDPDLVRATASAPGAPRQKNVSAQFEVAPLK